jgi:hypothetical protein
VLPLRQKWRPEAALESASRARSAGQESTRLTIRTQHKSMVVRKRRAVVANNLAPIVDSAGHRVGSAGDDVREIKHGHTPLIPQESGCVAEVTDNLASRVNPRW